MTDVNLVIEYQFANPVYAALSAAAAPKVAEKMIEAFENRVKAVAEGRA
jgi:coenzyme Q-binding protein COQ10